MITFLFGLTAALYALACGLFIVLLSKGHDALGRIATWILAAAAVCHVGFFVARFQVGGLAPFSGIYETLALASLAMVLAFLLARIKYRITVLGAFITPVTLLFFIGAAIGAGAGEVPRSVQSALLWVHIAANIIGIAAFALAFAAAAAYVVQERLLRAKQIGGVFQRLPPLDVLDGLGFRLLLIGFPLLTIGMVIGGFWVVRGAAHSLSAAQMLGIVTWLVFAGVLLLRSVAGWRGRRAAVGTMIGFACASAVLVGYMMDSLGSAG